VVTTKKVFGLGAEGSWTSVSQPSTGYSDQTPFVLALEMCALEAAVRKKALETSDARKEEQPSRPELRTDKVSRYEGSALWNICLLLYIHT
jgi:hypothetical protein